MPPQVGKSVLFHATATGEGCAECARAAIITSINDDGTVNLCVFHPTEFGIAAGGPEGTTPTPGCGTYPVTDPPAADDQETDEGEDDPIPYGEKTRCDDDIKPDDTDKVYPDDNDNKGDEAEVKYPG